MIRFTVILSILLVLGACETKRVEYRRRPSWMKQMGGNTATSATTADGTEIRWIDRDERRLEGFEQTIGDERLRIREEQEDGSVTLQCLLPVHVVVNALECLRRGEYRVIWEQLISRDQRAWYERQGQDGYENFLAFFRENRNEIAAMLNRMHVGKVYGEVVAETGPDGGSMRLRPDVARDFRFAEIVLVREGRYLKLADIR